MKSKDPAAVALGLKRSERKARAARNNGNSWQRPHFKKCRYFERVYSYKLTNNEWRVKFPIGKTPTGRIATYNPDYFCQTTGYYIEVCTSLPNRSEQGWKWTEALRRGNKLKVFWWEGEDITEQFEPKQLRTKHNSNEE